MGHIRLGELPRTRKWEQVVELIKRDGDAPAVAAALAARDPNYLDRLRPLRSLRAAVPVRVSLLGPRVKKPFLRCRLAKAPLGTRR